MGIKKSFVCLSTIAIVLIGIGCSCVVNTALAGPEILPRVPTIDPATVTQRFNPPKISSPVSRGGVLIPGLEEKAKIQIKQPTGQAQGVKFVLKQVIIEGSTIYTTAQLKQYYSGYLGKNVSLDDLQTIAEKMTARYRQDGYILSRVIIPEQRTSNGSVKFRAIEGYIGAVYIEDDTKSDLSSIEQYTNKIKAMRPLQSSKLERYILLLNDLPGVQIKTVLAPSQDMLGAADLTLLVTRKRADAEISYDNRGTRYLGPNEALGTVNINNVFFGVDRLTLQGVATPTTDELRFAQMHYTRYLGSNGLRLDLNGNYSETNPGFILESLDLIGRGKEWSAALTYPILRSRASDLWFGGKFEWTDSYTNFSSVSLYDDHLRSLRIDVTFNHADTLQGVTTFEGEFSKGLPIFGASQFDGPGPLSRFHGRGDYTKATADITRIQFIGTRWSVLTEVSGQYAFNNKLLAVEEFSFGGSQLGRAYDIAEITGDSGIAGKAELRLTTLPDFRFLQQIQYYIFYDAGGVWNVGDEIFQPELQTGTSAGCGLRTNLKSYLYADFEAAKPLTRPVDTQVLVGHDGNSWRYFFNFGVKL